VSNYWYHNNILFGIVDMKENHIIYEYDVSNY